MIEETRGGPLFFLSYAHPATVSGQQGLRPVADFFSELSGLVAEHAGLRTGEVPGFLDASIESGRQWNRELRTAIGTCEVFVALLSPKYFGSDWCGREWCAFARREISGSGTPKTAIIPVVWLPFRDDQAPRLVRDLQYFTPEPLNYQVAERYLKDGVSGMAYMGDENRYHTVLWRLAAHIVDIAYNCDVEPLILEPNELYNGFEESGR